MKYSKVYTKDNEFFFRFIKQVMNDRNISDEQMVLGLCDKMEWKGFLSGEYMNKLMMDRLLDRLGLNGLRCDTILFASDYYEWKARMDIVFS